MQQLGTQHMECQKLLWNQPSTEQLQGEQALTATPGPGIQLSADSVPAAGGAKLGTSNPLGCRKAEGSWRHLAQQLPNTAAQGVPFVQHPWKRLEAGDL